jgi:SAM-dependent methyltransferase
MNRVEKISRFLKERGLLWTFLYAFRSIGTRIVHGIDLRLIRIEQRKFLTGPSTVSSLYHTVKDNRRWNYVDWSGLGDEWTEDVKKYKGLDPDTWKASLINEMILKYIKKNAVVLEIGPGAGRWTAVLQPICSRLIIADINENCLSICKERFKLHNNIDYYLIETGEKEFIPSEVVPDNSINAVWSYDVFVHMNATDIEKYLNDFKHILKPGGCAIIHHAGTYPNNARPATRSFVDGRFFTYLVDKHNLILLEQNGSLTHMPGDLISVFTKRDS